MLSLILLSLSQWQLTANASTGPETIGVTEQQHHHQLQQRKKARWAAGGLPSGEHVAELITSNN